MTKHKKCLNVDFNTLNKHVRLKTMLKDIQIDSLKTNSRKLQLSKLSLRLFDYYLLITVIRIKTKRK